MHLNRRAFSRGVAVGAAATSMGLSGLSSVAFAQAKKWVPGRDYQVLDPRAPVVCRETLARASIRFGA